MEETFGQRLKRLRDALGYSISEAAGLIGVAESTYREWELGRGIRGEPYDRIARVFGISISELLLGSFASNREIIADLQQIEELISSIKVRL